MTLRLLGFFFISLGMAAMAQDAQITNIQNRNTLSLNGKWKFIIDPFENGYYNYRYEPFDQMTPMPRGAYFMNSEAIGSELIEYSYNDAASLLVPRDWNSQEKELLYYEGTIWYRKMFDYKKKNPTNRLFLHFGGANYQTEVYMNFKKLGKHVGGFTPFNFEITGLLTDTGNYIVAKVDNKRKPEGVPTLNTDWWNFGGLTRDVQLVEVPQTFVQDYSIQLSKGSKNEISGFIQLNGKDNATTVTVSIPEAQSTQTVKTDENGIAAIKIMVSKLSLWSPENPKLYDVVIKTDWEELHDQIGFRTIEAKGTEIVLNGKPIFLRGISIHEENPIRGGRATGREDARMLLAWAKELNCNFVRLAHYPHNEYMARLADKMGILVWEENPVYWTIQWKNPETFENAKNQLKELITRDKNRASVIIWSMANETPVSEPRTVFIRSLIDFARSLDNTRLISAALEKHPKENAPLIMVMADPLAESIDVCGLNEYLGWYDGLPDKIGKVSWEINYDKPVIISEFGGSALQGLHGDKSVRWTEEFQEEIYNETVKMLIKIPQFRGVTPWILTDFHSPRRTLPNVQDGWNRKGLISETGNKKRAFWALKKFYDEMEVWSPGAGKKLKNARSF
jgi:beta-glucuronidase